MKNLVHIKEAFDRVLRARESMSEEGKEMLLADLCLADRRFEIDWGCFLSSRDKRFFDEIENLRRYADHENLCFADGFEPYFII